MASVVMFAFSGVSRRIERIAVWLMSNHYYFNEGHAGVEGTSRALE